MKNGWASKRQNGVDSRLKSRKKFSTRSRASSRLEKLSLVAAIALVDRTAASAASSAVDRYSIVTVRGRRQDARGRSRRRLQTLRNARTPPSLPSPSPLQSHFSGRTPRRRTHAPTDVPAPRQPHAAVAVQLRRPSATLCACSAPHVPAGQRRRGAAPRSAHDPAAHDPAWRSAPSTPSRPSPPASPRGHWALGCCCAPCQARRPCQATRITSATKRYFRRPPRCGNVSSRSFRPRSAQHRGGSAVVTSALHVNARPP